MTSPCRAHQRLLCLQRELIDDSSRNVLYFIGDTCRIRTERNIRVKAVRAFHFTKVPYWGLVMDLHHLLLWLVDLTITHVRLLYLPFRCAPITLTRHLVGNGGFEPPTSGFQCPCATKLRQLPIKQPVWWARPQFSSTSRVIVILKS